MATACVVWSRSWWIYIWYGAKTGIKENILTDLVRLGSSFSEQTPACIDLKENSIHYQKIRPGSLGGGRDLIYLQGAGESGLQSGVCLCRNLCYDHTESVST